MVFLDYLTRLAIDQLDPGIAGPALRTTQVIIEASGAARVDTALELGQIMQTVEITEPWPASLDTEPVSSQSGATVGRDVNEAAAGERYRCNNAWWPPTR